MGIVLSDKHKNFRKDKKILEKAIAEDPAIFDYDSQYEEMQKVRDQKIIEQKEADKEKKVKNV